MENNIRINYIKILLLVISGKSDNRLFFSTFHFYKFSKIYMYSFLIVSLRNELQ